VRITALDDAAWAGPWRRIRVGEKLLLCLGLLLTALATPAWPGSALVAAAAVGLALGPARIPARALATAFAPPAAFILVGGASIALRVGEASADPWWAWGPLSLDAASAARAADVSAHAIAGTLALLLLATTTPMVDLLTWLHRLRVPGPLLEVASLTYRLLFVLLETALGVRDASAARLGDAPAGPDAVRRRWRNTATGLGTVLVRTWDRAARLQAGLEARGLDGELRALPAARAASGPFVAGTLAVLAGVWGVVGVVALR